MSSRDHGAHSPPVLGAGDGTQPEEPGRDEPANRNASAFVETWPEGDAHLFARALARVLVRQALREQKEIQLDDLCPPLALAG